MTTLRYPRVWWSLGWLLVAGVCFGSLLPGNLLPTPDVSDKVQHAGSYFLLMVWFSGLFSRGRDVLAVAVLLFLLGLLLDILQGAFTRRTFDLLDVAANGGGILIGFVLARLVLAGWCERVERLFPV
jgi:VanZ family protein